jgi:alkylhydroperoxidase/carboxymuconolactone decarboxylase family protein YurZ
MNPATNDANGAPPPPKRPETLRADFERTHGYWTQALDDLLRADPHYFAAYARLHAVPFRTNQLARPDRELISIAINAAATHMNEAAARLHIDNALRLGVPHEQIIEACQLASVLGTHTMSIGVPVLLDEMERAGRPVTISEDALTDEQIALKERFVADRGYWVPHWGAILQAAPDYFAAYLDFSSVPWLTGTLAPKLREFIYIAIDVSTTHLYELGIRVHIKNALGHGATFEEILDVMVLTSLLGLQSSQMAIPHVFNGLPGARPRC